MTPAPRTAQTTALVDLSESSSAGRSGAPSDALGPMPVLRPERVSSPPPVTPGSAPLICCGGLT